MTQTINKEDSLFLRLVQKAIFSNPFSPAWIKASCALSGLSENSPAQKRREAMETAVSDRLARLALKGITSLSAVHGNKRPLLRYAFLFATFHEFAPVFDQHINEQIKEGRTAIPFAHGPDIIKRLKTYGLGPKEACHILALFFQMRRAFYFINQMAGSSPAMKELRRDLWRNIFTDDISLYERLLWNRMEDFSTLILGPTGSGKGMAAAAIGRSSFIPYQAKTSTFSESFTAAFISLNLSQIAESLLESELFGHKKGAFTGASQDHPGVFARCSRHGSIFLDEIGEVSPQIQIKLLQTLQERLFTSMGSSSSTRFSGRVIAATNKDLDMLRQQGKFRDDFYYRLCSDTIHVPGLQLRFDQDQDELRLLAQVVLRRILGKEEPHLTTTIISTIHTLAPAHYPWPGNVRELEQCIRRILLKGRYEFQQAAAHQKKGPSPMPPGNEPPVQTLISDYCRSLHERYGTYEAVARITHLDRRTVKKYIDNQANTFQ